VIEHGAELGHPEVGVETLGERVGDGPALWPKNRTRTMFEEWFEIQMCSLVQDLYLDVPLELI
jgi:hypothetical protein